jgi:hypothetical protein
MNIWARGFILSLALSLGLMSPVPSFADARTDELLKNAGTAAGEATLEQLVKGYIDQSLASNAASATAAGTADAAGAAAADAGKESISAGSAFVFAVQLGFAIDAFANAKTDKGKGFAVADAIAAGVMMVNPIVGIIVEAVLLVVKLVDAGLSARHAKEMMEIYTRVMNNYKKAAEITKQMVKSEQVRFEQLGQQIDATQKRIEEGQTFLKDQCSDATLLDTMEKADNCLKSLVQVYAQYRHMTELMDDFLNGPTTYISVDLVLKNAKLDRAAFQADLDKYKDMVVKMQQVITAALKSYSEMTAALIQQKAIEQAALPEAMLLKRQCRTRAARLSLLAIKLLMPDKLQSIDPDPGTHVTDLVGLTDEMENFTLTACHDIKSGDVELDQIYSSTEDQFYKAYDLVQRKAAL